jgi:hypothetical protein
VNAPDSPAPNVDVLWCDRCGRPGVVRHRDLGDTRAAYELFCEQEAMGPDARLFGMGDCYDGPALDRAAYEAAVEGLARRCACGGAFRFAQAVDARTGLDEVGDDAGAVDRRSGGYELS